MKCIDLPSKREPVSPDEVTLVWVPVPGSSNVLSVCCSVFAVVEQYDVQPILGGALKLVWVYLRGKSALGELSVTAQTRATAFAVVSYEWADERIRSK